MTSEQFDHIKDQVPLHAVISIADIKDDLNRTLLAGTNCLEDSVHFYLKNGMFNYLVYDKNRIVHYEVSDSFIIYNLLNKTKFFPECVDFDIAKLLKLWNYNIKWKSFNAKRKRKR